MKTENYNPRFFKLMLFFALFVSTNSGTKKDRPSINNAYSIQMNSDKDKFVWANSPLLSELAIYKD